MAKVSVQVQSPRDVISPATAVKTNGKFALSEKIGQALTNPKVAYSVVHILPGRVRLRVPRLRYDADYSQRLQRLLAAEPLFNSVRLKPAAASVAVTYNSATVTSTKVGATLSCLIQTANEAIILKQPTQEVTQPEQLSWSFKLSALAGSLVLLRGMIGLAIPPLFLAGTICCRYPACRSARAHRNYAAAKTEY